MHGGILRFVFNLVNYFILFFYFVILLYFMKTLDESI